MAVSYLMQAGWKSLTFHNIPCIKNENEKIKWVTILLQAISVAFGVMKMYFILVSLFRSNVFIFISFVESVFI